MNYANWYKLAMEVVSRLSWRLWVVGFLFTVGAMPSETSFWEQLLYMLLAMIAWPIMLGKIIFGG